MKNRSIVYFAVASVLALPFALAGCDREMSSSSSKTTKSDGTVKTEEKSVTKSPDGTVTKEETSTTKTPTSP